ncbi:hypothetical protein [Herbaspirillum sp. alder98]|uniref:hypothetical protein n=1 Tax=Herbaspirillum sp. alder98 TaxID=2913096 RepID=UPI001CD8FB40|nr:hypothetical protein [Herbaspirillum sp. alder98]MCA1323584.1 hypothetical protein [Herbaspirillum sp. alder98]
MKPLHLVLAAGLLVSAGLAFFGDKTEQETVVDVPARINAGGANRPPVTPPSNQPARAGASDGARGVILAVKPRAELIGEQASATSGDLFARQSWAVPVATAVNAASVPAVDASAATLTYVGKKQEDGIWEVYLAQQDQLFIVRDKTVIDGKYRVESIVPPRLVLTYLPSSRKQTVMIGDAQ